MTIQPSFGVMVEVADTTLKTAGEVENVLDQP
jgi:hypothetical protein